MAPPSNQIGVQANSIFHQGNPLFMIHTYICPYRDWKSMGSFFPTAENPLFLTLTLRFHALVKSGITIFGFGSDQWIFLGWKKASLLFQSLYIGPILTQENMFFG
jgi:hypothetical protein